MITVEEKLELLKKLVYDEEEEKYIATIKEIDQKNNHIIEAKKEELNKRKTELINKERLLATVQHNETISKKSQEFNEKLLSKRQVILNDFLESLEKKAKEFSSSNLYRDYICTMLTKILKELNENEIIVTLNEEDKYKLSDCILEIGEVNNKKVSIEIAKIDIIGGFILSNKDRTYSYDNSFRSIIEENRYEIGKELFLSLEKTGGLNG